MLSKHRKRYTTQTSHRIWKAEEVKPSSSAKVADRRVGRWQKGESEFLRELLEAPGTVTEAFLSVLVVLDSMNVSGSFLDLYISDTSYEHISL